MHMHGHEPVKGADAPFYLPQGDECEVFEPPMPTHCRCC